MFASIQGEGAFAGVPSFFIRTIGCNLRCCWKNPNGTLSTCDTPYTSFTTEAGREFSLEEFTKLFEQYPTIKHVVITGGEPMLHDELREMIAMLLSVEDFLITIETNGTINRAEELKPYVDNLFLSFSPKLSSSNHAADPKARALHIHNNHWDIKPYLTEGYSRQLKFVISNQSDLAAVVTAVERECPNFDEEDVYLMPQGIDNETITTNAKLCVEAALTNNWRITDRMHIRFFGNVRGV
jgi:7-carboxy-7-deazaguanine synthase